jgi:hypothetical protein
MFKLRYARLYHVQSYCQNQPINDDLDLSMVVGREEKTLDLFDFAQQDQLVASNFFISCAPGTKLKLFLTESVVHVGFFFSIFAVFWFVPLNILSPQGLAYK